MKKREFGSLRRIGSGRWQARYLDPAGLRRTAPTTFATKAEALRWLSAAQTDMARGGWQDPQLGDIAFREWAERFLASRVDLKPKTLSDYQSLLHARILPKFAEWPIGRIRPMDVRDWIAAMAADGLSASRVRQGAHLLGSILSAAVNEGMIPTNPAQQARLPRLPRREMEFFDDPRPLRWADEPGFSAAVSSVLDNGALDVEINIRSNRTHAIGGTLGVQLKKLDFDLGGLTEHSGATSLHIRASFPQSRKGWR